MVPGLCHRKRRQLQNNWSVKLASPGGRKAASRCPAKSSIKDEKAALDHLMPCTKARGNPIEDLSIECARAASIVLQA